jgi:hypothetical protein
MLRGGGTGTIPLSGRRGILRPGLWINTADFWVNEGWGVIC